VSPTGIPSRMIAGIRGLQDYSFRPSLRGRPSCVQGSDLGAVAARSRARCLRHRVEHDTPPPNGCCRGTESYASGTC
jgi:hypothetical protein